MNQMLASVFAFLCVACANVRADDDANNIVVTGKAVTKSELEKSEARATFAKGDVLSFVQTGKPACKNGTVGATLEGATYTFGGQTFDFDHLVAQLHELNAAGKISCFRVQARTYDKSAYKILENEVVNKEQISLFWDDLH